MHSRFGKRISGASAGLALKKTERWKEKSYRYIFIYIVGSVTGYIGHLMDSVVRGLSVGKKNLIDIYAYSVR